jgi:tetratricopeptide (TPR) repeat protein
MLSWENDLSNYEERSVAATFNTQLDDLNLRYPDAIDLLKVLSFLDPECIPLSMITQGAEAMLSLEVPSDSVSLGTSRSPGIFSSLLRKIKKKPKKSPPLVQDSSLFRPKSRKLLDLILSPIELHDAILLLQNRSLLQHKREADASVLRMHDLNNIMVQSDAMQSGDGREWFEFAAALVCSAFERVEDPESYECWAACEEFIPHLQLLTKRNETFGNQNFSIMTSNMGVATYLRSCGRYSAAETLYRRILVVRRETLGAQHPDTVDTMNSLAVVYEEQGRYDDAETLLKRVLAVREKKLGPEHPDTLRAMNDLAVIYECQGRYKQAETLYKRVLAVCEKKLGTEHPHTLTTMNNLAILYQSQGCHDEAEALCKQVLVLREKKVGTEHLDTLRTRNNLANAYESQGRYKEAETLYKQVLAAMQKKLGIEHPHTLRTKNNLADVYRLQMRYDEAETLYKTVLAARERQLGVEHPDTLSTLNDLAELFQSQGRHDEAEALRQPVLAVTGKDKVRAEAPDI